MVNKIALIVFVLFSLMFFWMFRYDIVSPTPDHLYKLDRWTGKTTHFASEGALTIKLGIVEKTVYDFSDIDLKEQSKTVKEILGPEPK